VHVKVIMQNTTMLIIYRWVNAPRMKLGLLSFTVFNEISMFSAYNHKKIRLTMSKKSYLCK